jgi:hypothetical protein
VKRSQGDSGRQPDAQPRPDFDRDVPRTTGILNNELYIGRMVWNRLRYVKNPDIGKRVSRLNPSSEWITTEVPDLRIIPDELWSAAKERQAQTRPAIPATGKLDAANRPRPLFSGLTKSGVCGAGFIVGSANRSARPGHMFDSPDDSTG